MFKLSKIIDPISNLVRTVREVSKPNADRMRRRARVLDFKADLALAKSLSTRSRRRSLRLQARAYRRRQHALRLRQDAAHIDSQER